MKYSFNICINMKYGNTLDWKTYESITKYIYETLGKKPESRLKVMGAAAGLPADLASIIRLTC